MGRPPVTDPDVRAEIFRLRAQGLSLAKVADVLGIPKARVQRELGRPAARANGNSEGVAVDVETYVPSRGFTEDPEIVAARRQLELDRIEAERRALSQRETEAERRRVAIAEAQAGGNLGGLVAMIAEQIGGLRDELRAHPAAPPAAAPFNGPQSLSSALNQWKEIGNLVQTFSPPRAPSSKADLDYVVALEKLKIETQRIDAQFAADIEDRKAARIAEQTRANAIANAIEQSAPILLAAAQKWLEGPPKPEIASRPALTVVDNQTGAVATRGQCPNCGKPIELVDDGKADQCPQCGVNLTVKDSRIVVAREQAAPATYFAG